MDDEKHNEPEAVDELEIDDLDLEEPRAENVKGGSGGNFDSGTFGNIKRGL